MKTLGTRLLAFTAALLVAACGGGGSDTTPRATITSVKVFGDSLADVGTFGIRFTVQGSNSLTYPEHLARFYRTSALCPVYTPTGATSFVAQPANAACTGYAIGGGRINIPGAAASDKRRIPSQLADAAAKGSYTGSDLLMIDGGGNDAADIVGAFLLFSSQATAALGDVTQTSYYQLAASVLGPVAAGQVLGGTNGAFTLGGAYMTALADVFYDAITTSALDKGAQHVVILNVPGITHTPRFQQVLGGVAASQGAPVAAQLEGVFDGWIQAFNTQLAKRASGNARVVLVDGYTTFNQQIADKAQFALQNVTTPACPATGTDASGLFTYDFPTCTDAALSAMTPPAGATGGADWWKSYLFSDSFHPTPYGHQLVFQRISLALAAAGRI
ncbi:MAG: hypothetical protein RLZZ584_2818 [Pseudomonadota bacterium]|jgi:phospholipase/lecithinase/hemolysin